MYLSLIEAYFGKIPPATIKTKLLVKWSQIKQQWYQRYELSEAQRLIYLLI